VPSLAIEADAHDLQLLLRRAGRTHLVQLAVEGEPAPRPVLVRDYTRKATSDDLLHVEFFQVSMREKLTVSVPLRFVGEAPAVDQYDAIVVNALDSVSVQCLPSDIPDHIDVDITSLVDTSSTIFVRDLHVPDRVDLLTDGDVPVASVTAKAAVEEEEVTEEAAEEAVEAAEEAATAEAEAGDTTAEDA
jgi:large subunit ribosomal protein L25